MLELIQSPTIHETSIEEYFDGRVRFCGGAPIFNEPLVVLLFTNRCGSNLFAEYLTALNLAGEVGEALNYKEVHFRSSNFDISSFPEYIEKNARVYTSKGIAYGVKASVGQLAMLHRWRILKMFRKVVVFHVVRRDLLDQAISMSIAMQTRQWSSRNKSLNDNVGFDFREILNIMEQNSNMNTVGKLFAQALNLQYDFFIYENFTANPRAAIIQAMRALSMRQLEFDVPEPSIKKQANEINADFKNRFLAQLAETLSIGIDQSLNPSVLHGSVSQIR